MSSVYKYILDLVMLSLYDYQAPERWCTLLCLLADYVSAALHHVHLQCVLIGFANPTWNLLQT